MATRVKEPPTPKAEEPEEVTDVTGDEPAPTPVKETTKGPGVYVKPGCSITSLKGILGPGDKVKDEYLAGGSDSVSALIKSGHLERVS